MPISQYLFQLKLSSSRLNPSLAKKLHAQILKSGLLLCEPLPNTLLDVYGKCGLVQNALQLFGDMPHRDCVSWASLLTSCNLSNRPHKALSVSCPILKDDKLRPDHFVFASLVKACTNLGAVRQGKQVHARFLLSPSWEDNVVKSSLVDMYAKCELPDNARSVFDSISSLNLVSWTAMIGMLAVDDYPMPLSCFIEYPIRTCFLRQL